MRHLSGVVGTDKIKAVHASHGSVFNRASIRITKVHRELGSQKTDGSEVLKANSGLSMAGLTSKRQSTRVTCIYVHP
jgi:hypothetical protein